MIGAKSGSVWLLVAIVFISIGSTSGMAGVPGGVDSWRTAGPPAPPTDIHASSQLWSDPTFSDNTTPALDIDATGRAVLGTENETTYLWPSDPFEVAVSLSGAAPGEYSICLSIVQNGSSDVKRCQRVSTTDSPTLSTDRSSVTFGFGRWPINSSGPHRLSVVLEGTNSSAVNSTTQFNSRVFAVTPSGDLDGDGLSNEKERKLGTNLTETDTDRDGLLDGAEINEYDTDPTTPDTDGDGLRDGAEIQRGTNPNQRDTDDDGVFDGNEVEKNIDPTRADTDRDGLEDGKEMAIGTDPQHRDSDRDGLIDGRELQLGTNPLRVDSDGDMLSDPLEVRIGSDPTNVWLPLAPIGLLPILLIAVIGVWLGGGESSLRTRIRAGMAGFQSGATNEPGSNGEPGRSPETEHVSTESPPMTDEERVLDLLVQKGGRTKQVQVVDNTDWSKAKVSRVLSRMEDEGDITRIKIGRENLVCLEGHEPEEVRSPFDE